MSESTKTVAVIFGGRSAEHDVSIITAFVPVIESLKALGHAPVPVYIAKDGSWYSEPAMQDVQYFKDPAYETRLQSLKKLELSFDQGLTLVTPGMFSKRIKIDLVFPAMHGTYGEDGSLMGLLRMAQVPFVGCDIFASAVAMDKVLTKQVASAEGVPVVPYVWFTAHGWEQSKQEFLSRIQKLSSPWFVKPVHLGSSIGMSVAKTVAELEQAIEVALHYDDKVLVEEVVKHLIEVTLPIMGNDTLTFAHIERPLNKSEFFNFEDKYLSGGKGSGVNSEYSEVPAKIDPELAAQVLEYGQMTYRALGASGIARVDFLIEGEKGLVYMNEVNTLPGSLYHHNWKKRGVSGVELVSKLMALAEERHAKREGLTHTFQSDILKKMKPKGT